MERGLINQKNYRRFDFIMPPAFSIKEKTPKIISNMIGICRKGLGKKPK